MIWRFLLITSVLLLVGCVTHPPQETTEVEYPLIKNSQILVGNKLPQQNHLRLSVAEEKLIARIKARIAQPKNQQRNNNAIINMLLQLPKEVLANLQPSSSSNFSGWASLAYLLKSSRIGSNSFKQSFVDWQQIYPKHLGNTLVFKNLNQITQAPLQRYNSIAIFLPKKGSYAQAATAIKEGFLAAFYSLNNSYFQPKIKFYDSSETEIQILYQLAVNNGSELIVGPLEKKTIRRLAELPKLSVPVLALNQLPNVTKNNLYQFGLNPENEAEQIVSKAIKEGHSKALILFPNSALGKRISRAIDYSWQQAKGITLKSQSYALKSSDYSHAIKLILNLNESIARIRHIKKFIPSAKFTLRRRRDVDAIFLVGNPLTARLLNPQLQFYRATRVPIYAISQIYTGVPNKAQNIDLNNIIFCTIPWLFDEDQQSPTSFYNLRNILQQIPAGHLRLFALGMDAYNLLPHLNSMANNPYQGATGQLTLNNKNHIKRELVFAKFTAGLAQLDPNNAKFTHKNPPIIKPYILE